MLKLSGGSDNLEHTQALLECLRNASLLVGDLPEAVCFNRGKLGGGGAGVDLRLNYGQKLGHLYEDVLEYLLTESAEVELIQKGVQVFNGDRVTLGELDYVLRDKESGVFIHLELAVKFYLIRCHGKDGVVEYPGPDPRDNWINKLERLRRHQLRMSHTPEGRELLLEKFGASEVVAQQLIYGKIFDHYDESRRPCPPFMNSDSERGTWRYLSEWCSACDSGRVTIIPKYLWPVDVRALVVTLPEISREDFVQEASERCVMIWDEGGQNSQFIAPDTWCCDLD